MVVRVGVVGTSWWADAMYLPPLSAHAQAAVLAVCGRNQATTEAFADRWGVEQHFDDPIAMLDCVELDAVVRLRWGDRLIVEVSDDGRGGANLLGSGLSGLQDRVQAVDGWLHVASPPGGPTTVTAELPCAS